MNVASLELCRELYKLSGWKTPMDDKWYDSVGGFPPVTIATAVCPAYDLGYLFHKLPETVDEFYDLYVTKTNAFYGDLSEMTGHDSRYWVEADTPEDILAKLAILLFKQGTLNKL